MNTSDALTALYDVIKSDLNNKTKLELIKEFDSVLSLHLLEENEIDEELKKYIETKLEERAQAKKDKDFTKADLIRDELESRGILIKDTREGTTYQLK
jgi:cysteinyl-tRNA synthetase